MSQGRRSKNWSHSEGPYGYRIRLYEDPKSKIIYAEMRDPSRKCGYRTVSLRHRDKDRAKKWAADQVLRWKAGVDQARTQAPTQSRILALYKRHQTPTKCKSEQEADARRGQLWTRFLGVQKDLRELSLRDWQGFIAARREGAIDGRGNPIPPDERKRVREGTVAADLTFLRSLLSWACRWRTNDGYLMETDPTRGFSMPTERNPRRPTATDDRFQKVRATAEHIEVRKGRGKRACMVRAPLAEILDLVNGTGRRINAVLKLRASDLCLDQGPYGAIRWPADTDKLKKEWLTPINADVRAAIDRLLRQRPIVGQGYLFASVKDDSKPLAVEVASEWLLKAEQLAGVPKQEGSLWHAYRRKWATERKHLPDVDVAAAGGWGDVNTLKLVYQQADQEGMYRVVSEPARLREAL